MMLATTLRKIGRPNQDLVRRADRIARRGIARVAMGMKKGMRRGREGEVHAVPIQSIIARIHLDTSHRRQVPKSNLACNPEPSTEE